MTAEIIAAELKLRPGNLVRILAKPDDYNAIASGEIHQATDDNGTMTYRVRIVESSVNDLVPGSFADFPHSRLQQLGLDLSRGSTWDSVLGDPLVTQYLSAQDRGRLAQVSSLLALTQSSVAGTMAVTPEVFTQIMRNRELGEPPLRPEKGERGEVTWMVISGNPAVGRSVETKQVQLEVRAFTGVPRSGLPVITTQELDRRVQLEFWARVRDLATETGLFTKDNEGKKEKKGAHNNYIDPEDVSTVCALVLSFADKAREALPPEPPSDASAEAIRKIADSVLQPLVESLQESRAGRQFHRFLSNEGGLQAAMWRRLGRYVATLKEQAAIVSFQSSTLSQKRDNSYRDGEYLIVASRRYTYLLKADGRLV
jgi:hypothetical protein